MAALLVGRCGAVIQCGREAIDLRPLAQEGLVPMRSQLTPAERFFAKVEFTETCWLWCGARTSTGYGNFMLSKSRRQWVRAHCFAYEFVNGPIPCGLPLDHLCFTPVCVFPDHLEPVPQIENIRRGHGHGKETHCPKGHAYTAENTEIERRADGSFRCRRCRTCRGRHHAATEEAGSHD